MTYDMTWRGAFSVARERQTAGRGTAKQFLVKTPCMRSPQDYDTIPIFRSCRTAASRKGGCATFKGLTPTMQKSQEQPSEHTLWHRVF